MRKIIVLLLLLSVLTSFSQEKMEYFLPNDVRFNKNIPTPEQYFGQALGEWHLTHDQVLNYMKEIARISDRAILQEYARSYENRPLVHIIFTSPDNHKRLDELKALHKKHAEPNENVSSESVPLVINLGYGVHGNESSATNSSLLTAYYLAAAEGDKIDKLLVQCIVLVDPCLNPDGFTRHSTWANMHQSSIANGDGNSRQFSEVWPGGRTNHYWFDLNRDYLLLVHPESIGRVAKFHEWLPNVVTDHHEMGYNSTFFFQPGVPTRNNPLTPENNYTLTHEIAAYHAKYLDKIGTAYFSEEQFDDYYLGKGSSYPDINSSIGILFEQAGFRGRVRETDNGMRKLAYGIRNQFTVTLSTLEAALDLKEKLLCHQKEFYVEAFQMAEKDPVKAYVFGNENDQQKSKYFVRFLRQHQIDVFENTKEISAGSGVFKSGASYIVPTGQKQYRLIKSMFQTVDNFADSTFYDVSTWTLPHTFNLDFAEIRSLKEISLGNPATGEKTAGKIIGPKSKLAYLFRWNELHAPKALYQLQKEGIMVKVANDKFSFEIDGKQEDFTYGTILLPVNGQAMDEGQIFETVTKIASETGIDFFALQTGLSPVGIDLGSGNFMKIDRPEILMFVGGSVSSSDAGEIWHLLDLRYQMPVTLVETDDLHNMNLARYNTIVMPGGQYSEWSGKEAEQLRSWTQDGGTLIACESATLWASKNKLGNTSFKKAEKPDTTLNFSYADRRKEYSLNAISGAIFNSKMDITHPLCWGYLKEELPVFKSGTSVAEPLGRKYSEPVKFAEEPFLSGFVSDINLDRLKGAPVVSVQSIGRGKIISYHESTTFRGIWLGTNKLFANGVFFGGVIR